MLSSITTSAPPAIPARASASSRASAVMSTRAPTAARSARTSDSRSRPARSAWLSLTMTSSKSPTRWFSPPPQRTAYFSKARSPGVVLRVSRTRARVPGHRVHVAPRQRGRARHALGQVQGRALADQERARRTRQLGQGRPRRRPGPRRPRPAPRARRDRAGRTPARTPPGPRRRHPPWPPIAPRAEVPGGMAVSLVRSPSRAPASPPRCGAGGGRGRQRTPQVLLQGSAKRPGRSPPARAGGEAPYGFGGSRRGSMAVSGHGGRVYGTPRGATMAADHFDHPRRLQRQGQPPERRGGASESRRGSARPGPGRRWAGRPRPATGPPPAEVAGPIPGTSLSSSVAPGGSARATVQGAARGSRAAATRGNVARQRARTIASARAGPMPGSWRRSRTVQSARAPRKGPTGAAGWAVECSDGVRWASVSAT